MIDLRIDVASNQDGERKSITVWLGNTIVCIGYQRQEDNEAMARYLRRVADQLEKIEPPCDHVWSYWTASKTYKCRCGAEQTTYPYGPATYKD